MTYLVPSSLVPGSVPYGADDNGRVRTPAVVDEPCEPKVAELGVEGFVQHDVAQLDIPVQNALLLVLM